MASLDVNTAGSTSATVCKRCGTAYRGLKGNFPVSYGVLYKGSGFLPYCKKCVSEMFTDYLEECGNSKDAVRQVCRKLDLYWSDKVFDIVERQNTNRSIMTAYLSNLAGVRHAGKSYDDTLREENCLWVWPPKYEAVAEAAEKGEELKEDDIEISDEVKAFWGPGYTPVMYQELEQRREYWMSHLPQGLTVDLGLEALIRQICNLEIDINKDRAAGKSVEKNISTLNNLLGSAMLKPAQKTDGDAAFEKTPFGVWIDRWENKRPIPDPDPEFEDSDGIIKYVTTWFLGHLGKMLNIKNSYVQLYEDEIAKLRVDHPEYEEDDDETLIYDIFADEDNGGDG